jgi:hypothetical protein
MSIAAPRQFRHLTAENTLRIAANKPKIVPRQKDYASTCSTKDEDASRQCLSGAMLA